MNLAWKEMRHNRKHYLLIALILILMIFMVIFLSGLAHGLSKAISAALDRSPATYYAIQKDVDRSLAASSLTQAEVTKAVKDLGQQQATPLIIQRSYLTKEGSDQ